MFDYIIPVCVTLLIPLVAGKIGASLLKFNEFRKVVSENSNSDVFNSCLKSCSMLVSSFQSVVYQKIWGLSKVHLLPSSTYSTSSIYYPPSTSKFVSIYHNMKWYKVPLYMKRGPVSRNISCITQNGINITDHIIQFAGPLNDFFGLGITPAFFGIYKMNITCNGEDYIFNRDTPIVFSDENKVERVESTPTECVESTPVESTPVECVESTPVECVESTPVESTPVECVESVESCLTLNT